MMKTKRVIGLSFLLMLVMLFLVPAASSITLQEEWDKYTNSETGYEVRIRDKGSLLTRSEEDSLAEVMTPLTEYGNIGILTADRADSIDDWEIMFQNGSSDRLVLYIDGLQTDSDSYPSAKLLSSGSFKELIGQDQINEMIKSVEKELRNRRYDAVAEKIFCRAEEIITGQPAQSAFHLPLGYALIALIIGLTVTITICFMTKFNPSIQKAQDLDTLPSQKSYIKITHKEMTYRKRIDLKEEKS